MVFHIRDRWEQLSAARIIAGGIWLVGITMMIGWQFNLLSYQAMAESPYPLRSHLVVAMVIAGLALWLRCGPISRERSKSAVTINTLSQMLSVLMIVLGTLNIFGDAQSTFFPIDRLLRSADLGIYTFQAGSISLLTALGVAICGLSLLLINHPGRDGRYFSEYLAVGIVALMTAPLIGHLYTATAIIQIPQSLLIPIEEPVFLILLSLGILFARPNHHLMTNFLSEAPGGRLLRRVLPTALLILVALDLLGEIGVRQGLYTQDKVSPLVILVDMVVLTMIIWRTAFMLNHEHTARIDGESTLNKANEIMRVVSDNIADSIFVKDRDGRLIFANPATLKTLGRDMSSAIGRTNEELFPNLDDSQSMSISDQAILESGQAQHIEQTIHYPELTRTFYVSKSPWRDKDGKILGIVGISTDITERKKAENALKMHEAELEELVAQRTTEVSELIGHLESTREEEKRAIARELHDDLGSSLTALNMHMAIIFKKMSEDPALTERVAQIKALLSAVTITTRRIQNGLRPDKLDIFGIKTTLVEQALEFEKYTSIACKTNLPDEDISYPSHVGITLFRIVQEALNNVARHAHATQVNIILDDNEDEVSLTVRDNGVGISEDQKKNYRAVHGLRGMRERAAYLGGRIDISSTPNHGTKLNVTFPKNLFSIFSGERSH